MATSKITYKGGLRTEAVHLKSGTAILTDAPTDNRGQGASFSPTDLVATGLGACVLTIMGIKALDSGIDMEGATAEVEKIMASNPRRISEINVKITMPSNNYTDKEKILLERSAHHCPVAKSLSENLKETIEIIYPANDSENS